MLIVRSFPLINVQMICIDYITEFSCFVLATVRYIFFSMYNLSPPPFYMCVNTNNKETTLLYFKLKTIINF